MNEKKVYLEVPEFTGRSVPVTVAARAMGKTENYVRQGILQGILTFGTAIQMEGTSRYDYYISPLKFWQETGFIYRGEAAKG